MADTRNDLYEVHPHACGEILEMGDGFWLQPGTSPRLWGDFAAALLLVAESRYIPTPVGRLK